MHIFTSCSKRFNNTSNPVNQSPRFIASFRRKKRRLRCTDLQPQIQKKSNSEQQDGIFQFLAILDSSYEAVRSQILLIVDLPSVDEVVAMVEREEIRRVVMGQHLTCNPEAKVFATLSRNPNSRPETKGDQTLVCDHYKHRGHRKDECWFLHPHLRPVGSRWKIARQGGYRLQPKKGALS
jgi:hypothetical protein